MLHKIFTEESEKREATDRKLSLDFDGKATDWNLTLDFDKQAT